MVQHLGIRRRLEAKEAALSPFAARSYLSRGRLRPEDPSPVRTEFQRDRDRILHCMAFRRLKHKTQVFLMPEGDHYVTRLTHTLEVAQIARTITRALDLNEDLAEAIALGHDLGHTPFGHIGEQVLDGLYPGGFRHNKQSLRVVDYLENEGQGLNLTWEVRNGILNHSKGQVDTLNWRPTATLEGDTCKLSDMIAYVNHDLGDALRAGVIIDGDIPEPVVRILGRNTSERVNVMVSDIIVASWEAISHKTGGGPCIRMSPRVSEATNMLREFLDRRVYEPSGTGPKAREAKTAVHELYLFFQKHPEEMPDQLAAKKVERRVVDYVAGMTDQFATRTAARIRRYGHP